MALEDKDLISNFKDSAEYFYSKKENYSQKSKHWKVYDYRKFNLENLVNFRSNDSLSTGLDDQTDQFTFKIFAKILEEIPESYILNNLPKKNIGNSKNLIKYKNVLIDYNKLIHIHWFFSIEKEIFKENKKLNICEIGGGFGSFSELFIKNYNSKLLSIDLPEANLMTSYYLHKNFPEKKIYLFKDYNDKKILTYEDFIYNDIIILPPNCKIDKKIKFDLFINARSMMEMNFDIIKSYFNFIHQYSHENSFFLNINRYEKTSVGESIRIANYPYDKNWKVIVSKSSFNQKWIHFLLTKRCFDNVAANIVEELDRIKLIGEKFHGLHKDYSPSLIFLKSFIKKFLKLLLLDKFIIILGNILFKISLKLRNFK